MLGFLHVSCIGGGRSHAEPYLLHLLHSQNTITDCFMSTSASGAMKKKTQTIQRKKDRFKILTRNIHNVNSWEMLQISQENDRRVGYKDLIGKTALDDKLGRMLVLSHHEKVWNLFLGRELIIM